MIGKKVKAKIYDSSKTPEILTVLDKVRGVYVHLQEEEKRLSRVVTIDYYLCKQEDGSIVYIKPSNVERIIEAKEKPHVSY